MTPGLVMMSEEEGKIRGELENEIERDLEEEIKDGIYHLALRLHRLYQHRRERNAKLKLKHKLDKYKPSQYHNKDKALSEVNISIKMDGATKIEIKESKKQVAADYQKGLPLPQLPPRSSSTCRSNTTTPQGQGQSQGQTRLIGSNGVKKFDWANSLRTGAGPAIVNRRLTMNYINLENTNRNDVDVVRASGSGQRKGNPSGLSNKQLELGWKC